MSGRITTMSNNEQYYSYEDVVEKYNKAFALPNKIKVKKYDESHIFDEEQSVRWNREQVQIRNAELMAESNRISEIKRNAIKEATEDVINYLHQETKTPVNILRKLFDYVRYDILDNYSIEGHIETVEEICDIFKEEK